MHRYAVAWLLCVSLAMACHAASDPGSRADGTSKQVYRIDCNRNGIKDSQDIENGVAPDRNRNGKIDSCDPDTDLRGYAARAMATPPDSLYVGVVYRPHIGIHVHFTIRAQSVARVVLKNSAAQVESVLVDREYDRGGHAVEWVPKDSVGGIRQTGNLVVTVRVDGDSVSVPLQWAWGQPPSR